MARPVRLAPHKVTIEAPRELVYQMLSSFGSGRLNGSEGESSRVISRSGNDIVAEFKTRSGLVTITTVEQVALDPPARISFEHIEGPFHQSREEFVLSDVDGSTELSHRGEFVWSRAPVVGWLVGRLVLKWLYERVLTRHMEHVKAASEARAARSHVFRRTGAARR